MSLNIEPSKRRKVIIGVSACAVVCLIGLGIIARNGWFGRNADALVRNQGEALTNSLTSGTPQ